MSINNWTKIQSNGVELDFEIEPLWWGVRIEYRGSMADMVKAGAMTEQMAESYKNPPPGGRRKDERGHRYLRTRAAIKAAPDRVILQRWIDLRGADEAAELRFAMTLPGVASKYPQGIQIPEWEDYRQEIWRRAQARNIEVRRGHLRLVWSNPVEVRA